MELWYLISAHHLMMLYICTKFQENISKGFRVIERMRFVYRNFQRGIFLLVAQVELWYLFCLHCALYLYQVLSKYLIGFQSYGLEQ